MDRQSLQILEDGAIDDGRIKARQHFEALDYYKEKLRIAESNIEFSFGFWSRLTGKWDAAQREAEICDNFIRMNTESLDQIEKETNIRIDYIYRRNPDYKPIEAVSLDTLET